MMCLVVPWCFFSGSQKSWLRKKYIYFCPFCANFIFLFTTKLNKPLTSAHRHPRQLLHSFFSQRKEKIILFKALKLSDPVRRKYSFKTLWHILNTVKFPNLQPSKVCNRGLSSWWHLVSFSYSNFGNPHIQWKPF